VIHQAIRKLMRSGRSLVFTLPNFAALKIGAHEGDNFIVRYDDVANTVTYQRFELPAEIPTQGAAAAAAVTVPMR